MAGPQEKAMAQRIAQKVQESGQLSHYSLGVKYENGVATLMGAVTDEAQAQAAMSLASQVQGVERVVNNLEIKPTTPQPQEGLGAPREEQHSLLMSLADASEPQAAPARQIQPVQMTQAPKQLRQRPQGPPMRMAQRPQPMRRGNSGAPMPMARSNMPGVMPAGYQQGGVQQAQCAGCNGGGGGGYGAGGGYAGGGGSGSGGGLDSANMPGYAWPSYAGQSNYAALTYPKQYSPTAWPYIGPFYPYPQVPLGWRKVSLEWDDGWWFLDFSHHQCQ
jgi:hypothetical protein